MANVNRPTYGTLGFTLIIMLSMCSIGYADIISYHVIDSMAGTNNYDYNTYSYNYNFANSTVSGVYIDPAQTNWIAWHNQTTPYVHSSGQLFVGSYTWLGVDDYLTLTITDPLGNTLTRTMDDNGSYGDPFGPQAVIFGTAAAAPNRPETAPVPGS